MVVPIRLPVKFIDGSAKPVKPAKIKLTKPANELKAAEPIVNSSATDLVQPVPATGQTHPVHGGHDYDIPCPSSLHVFLMEFINEEYTQMSGIIEVSLLCIYLINPKRTTLINHIAWAGGRPLKPKKGM